MNSFVILFFILSAFEVGSSLAGFIFYKKLKGSYWQVFPFFLAFISICDLSGEYMGLHKYSEYNKILFNYIVIPLEFLFYFWIFHRAFKATRYKKFPVFCIVFYLASCVIDNLFFSSHEYWFSSFSYTIGNLLMLVLIMCFFLELVTSNSILNFRQNMLFWVSLGLLIFFLGSFPYFGMRNKIVHNSRSILIIYSYVVNTLNCLMYLMFIISFIWGKPQQRSSSS